ncbi:hypothetical protein [Dactylosporangium sp. CA-233914]|uniref:hypothetical protein n=1 Tax=Dactylosporangium sp. CA-233914 TaxID=3239934 RepID=UPI003D8AFF7D
MTIPSKASSSTLLCVERADIRQTGDEHTLILAAAGVHVLLIRLRYAGWVDEVINSAGAVATWAVNAWTLVGPDLSLEFDGGAAVILGAPRLLRLRLDVDDDTLEQVRAALPRSSDAPASWSTRRRSCRRVSVRVLAGGAPRRGQGMP